MAVDPAVEIVAAVGDVEPLCEACDRHRPGVVVLTDIRMPPTSTDQGIRLAGELERVHNRAELMAAIRAVADGGSMIDPKIVETLVSARSRAARSPLNELTAREREVLSEIAQGRATPRSPSPCSSPSAPSRST